MLLVPEGLRPCLLCATWIPTGRRRCDECRRAEWEGYLDAGLGLAAFYGIESAPTLPTPTLPERTRLRLNEAAAKAHDAAVAAAGRAHDAAIEKARDAYDAGKWAAEDAYRAAVEAAADAYDAAYLAVMDRERPR